MCSAASAQRGVSLVEVLVAVLVLSIGLLGLAGINMAGIRNNHNAYMRSQATVAASDILDRLRLNREGSVGDGYTLDLDDDAPNIGNDSSDIERDVAEWLNTVALLPSGDGAIDCGTVANQCTIVVQWSERLTKGQGGDFEAKNFTVRARL